MKKIFIVVLGFVFVGMTAFQEPSFKKEEPPFMSKESKWVDSVFNSLSPDERIGQLFMVAAYSNKDNKHLKEIKDLIIDYKIGGLIWMQGGPVRQAKLSSYYQSISKTPLLYSIDAEWGLSMRLDSTPRYPRQMTLGAIENDSLIYLMGRQIARECKRLGLHVNFAPVADVNNNPLNPVIGARSFGEDKYNVARKSYMYMKGLQDEKVMANGKHFPGHGDTDSDSHKSLPLIGHTRQRLDSLELYPFKYLFERGLASIMVAHLNIPSIDSTVDLPSTLSPKVVNELLKNELGFKGLIFTDALNMKGVTKFYDPGIVDVKALLAGNDVLLFSGDVQKAMIEIKMAIAEGKITQEELDARCKKILRAKYWCGLNRSQEIVTRNLNKELNNKESETLNDKLAEASLTLLKNENNFLPLMGVDTMRVLELSFGIEEVNDFGNTLRNYCYVEHLGLSHNPSQASIQKVFEKLYDVDLVVLQLNKATVKSDDNYGMGTETLKLIDSISKIKPSALVIFANPYLINKINSFDNFKAVILAYEYMPSLQRATANALVGLSTVNGKLPVSTNHFAVKSGIVLKGNEEPAKKSREKYFDAKFRAIDSIAIAGIAEKAYPGCQIVAMKDGKVIYQKSFGTYTYHRNSKPVDDGTMYDLASITKIASSSLALMKLRSEGKFDYSKTLGEYLPELQTTDKSTLVIRDVLSHQSGLQAWIPYYQSTLSKSWEYKPGYYSKSQSDEFPIQVAKNLYAVKGFNDTIFQRLAASKVLKPGQYLYSDLGYYYMQQIIERQTGKKLNEYVQQMYARLGIGLTYLPLNYFSKTQIAPTENDEKFRKQVVQGYVHDPGAALLGGVAGHAGLFGNALEVAKIMQLFLNKGELNGMRVLDSNVVKEFTACQYCPGNRRGLCFEKPETDKTKNNPVVEDCSPESYGHSGFTGTFAWADPINNLVVVFLSNRVYPNADDNKLAKLGIRSKVHKAFYQALNN